MTIAENGIKDVEDASKVIAHILQELAKVEAMKSKQDTTATQFIDSSFNNPDYVFESDLHYGSYQGLVHG